jgi:hypothetical protein
MLVAAIVAACPSTPPGETPPAVGDPDDAARAIAALQAGDFEKALTLAEESIGARGGARAHLVAAIARYRNTMHDLAVAVMHEIARVDRRGRLPHAEMRLLLTRAEAALEIVDGHLDRAARDPDVSLELCLACWEIDWNRDGRIDDRDRSLLEIEQDAAENPIPRGDPRRRPTFRFDLGDVHWARAMVSFQRALLDLVLAYRWTELDDLFFGIGRRAPSIVIRLEQPGRVTAARERILAGLDDADRAREAYLAESDDDREWLPNPRQQNHPLPLPVDGELYETWRLILRDLRALVHGEEGLDVAEIAQLGDHRWRDPPRGYIDVGRLLSDPGDVTIDLSHLEALDERTDGGTVERVLRDVFGEAFAAEMTPSPLPARLERMKREIESGAESFERKLRYLLWVN